MQLLDELLVAGVTMDDGVAPATGSGDGKGNGNGNGDGDGDVFDAYDGAFNVESRQF